MHLLKRIGKSILCKLLEAQTKRLRSRNTFVVVAVVGSVGKTSTKLAIAKTLSHKQKVIYQDGNYNDRLTVPLVLFGHSQPGLFNLFAWAKILLQNERLLRKPYGCDVAVLELGTDGPGQLKDFAYLHPDVLVVTAIAGEHMEYFGSLDAVAQEELVPTSYSKQVLLNHDDVPAEYLPDVEHLLYGTTPEIDYRITKHVQEKLIGQTMTLKLRKQGEMIIETHVLGLQGAKAVLAAAAVADMLGWSHDDIVAGLANIKPVAGRMQLLHGQNGSIIIDDTYNASPIAVSAALDVLGSVNAKHKIAILGTMNELGETAEEEHRRIGQRCTPAVAERVITIGSLAEQFLAPEAEKNGCLTKSFNSPVEAGVYVRGLLSKDTVVLAKGSQNGVFAEEAVKQLLEKPGDADRLVRQSGYWMSKKRKQFPEI